MGVGHPLNFGIATPQQRLCSPLLCRLLRMGRNVAFPRLNAFGYWMYLMGGLLLYAGFLTGMAKPSKQGASGKLTVITGRMFIREIDSGLMAKWHSSEL